ncbi:MAG: DUF2062 domain-containing protein [Verrucomicrobiota bacterium]
MGEAPPQRGLSRWLKEHWAKLLAIRDAPASVALGAAIGILVGFTPLFGFKALLALGFAFAFRANKLATLVGLGLHELTFPIRPALYLLEFEIGCRFLRQSPHMVAGTTFGHIQWHDWFKWSTLRAIGGPTLIGSLAIGLPVAVLTYRLTKGILAKHIESSRPHPPSPDSAPPT